MSASIFNAGTVKILKDILKFKTGNKITMQGTSDPTSVAQDGIPGDLYITTSGSLYRKTDSGVSINWNKISDSSDLSSYIPLSQKAANNGVATLDSGGKIPANQLPNSVMEYKGNYNATSNTPTLVDGTGNAGDVYRVNVAGTQNYGSGSITFNVGDFVVYSGTIWEKSINSNEVITVNGQKGVVVLDTDDIAEGLINLYYTDARASAAAPVQTVFSRAGNVTAQGGDYTASQVTNVPSGNITSNNVQGALNEVQTHVDTTNTNLSNHITNSTGAHASSAISNIPSGNVTSTDVQSAINELQNHIDVITTVGDLPLTTFTGSNNVSSPTNVTGFAFANANIRSFDALVSVVVSATTSLYETFKLRGIQKGASWDLNYTSDGDNAQVVFSITNAGQIQYISSNFPGFTTMKIEFRSIITTV